MDSLIMAAEEVVTGLPGDISGSLALVGYGPAAIGPGIGPDSYPVDAGVRDRFAAAFGEEVVRHPGVDLAAAAGAALRQAGVPASAIASVDACTYREPERFYSFRRDGAACGRQAGVVWAREPT